MLRDVSDCEILCYDSAAIPMMALLQPSLFIFFLLKKEFDRVGSAVLVQFFQFSVSTNTGPSCPVMTAIMFVFWTADLGIWIICLFPI
jgi:hypothetical protein